MSEQIKTRKALEALPPLSIVRDKHGYPWLRGNHVWTPTENSGGIELATLLPVDLLFDPRT